MKKTLIAFAFSIGYSFLAACHIVCLLNVLMLPVSLYPRFFLFCIIVILMSIVLIVGLLFLNSKYWNHTLKTHDNELLFEIICTSVLIFPFWSLLDKIIKWAQNAF